MPLAFIGDMNYRSIYFNGNISLNEKLTKATQKVNAYIILGELGVLLNNKAKII